MEGIAHTKWGGVREEGEEGGRRGGGREWGGGEGRGREGSKGRVLNVNLWSIPVGREGERGGRGGRDGRGVRIEY